MPGINERSRSSPTAPTWPPWWKWPPPLHRRPDDQPHPDAQGRDHRLPRLRPAGAGRHPDKPISFEVFSDEFDEMRRQAMEIMSWGKNVYVKIPVTNTRAEPADDLIASLASGRRQTEHHGRDDAAAGAAHLRRPGRLRPSLHFGFRRPHRRHRPRSAAAAEAVPGHPAPIPIRN
jgi:hypothetical protein